MRGETGFGADGHGDTETGSGEATDGSGECDDEDGCQESGHSESETGEFVPARPLRRQLTVNCLFAFT